MAPIVRLVRCRPRTTRSSATLRTSELPDRNGRALFGTSATMASSMGSWRPGTPPAIRIMNVTGATLHALTARTITRERPVRLDARACNNGSSLVDGDDCAYPGAATATMAYAITEDRMKRAILRIRSSISAPRVLQRRRDLTEGMMEDRDVPENPPKVPIVMAPFGRCGSDELSRSSSQGRCGSPPWRAQTIRCAGLVEHAGEMVLDCLLAD